MRNRFILLGDLALVAIAAGGAFALRFDLQFFRDHRREFLLFFYAALLVKPVVLYLFGMYRRFWRYATANDLASVTLAVSAASVAVSAVIAGALMTGRILDFSRQVLLIDWLLSLAMIGGIRMSVRILGEAHQAALRSRGGAAQRRVLVAGAGEAGVMVVRELQRNPQLGLRPAGFLDDAPEKYGKSIGGVRVLGRLDDLALVAAAHNASEVIIAMPAAGGSAIRAVAEACRKAGLQSRTVPGVFEMVGGKITVSRLRNVEITDLLRRSHHAQEDQEWTAAYLKGRTVLITGAGGSIGSELARQIASASPSHLVLVGHGENSVFEAEARLRAGFPDLTLTTVIADIRDNPRLAMVFDRFRPTVVFHAAAHKHVPLMEQNPEEAITNNIIGTRNVVDQALRTGAERFVLISTDKAANPQNLLGQSKAVCEWIVESFALRDDVDTRFVAVRFGNVLGSSGSVIPIFRRQIERGGPVTVTDPRMTRFFMTIPEAASLVVQAGAIGGSGQIYVLDMGTPVKIVDLARQMIRLSGFAESDLRIEFVGLRPGEKLYEEPLASAETTLQTPHPKLRIAKVRSPENSFLLESVLPWLAGADPGAQAVREQLRRWVPEYSASAPRRDAAR
jgi:FlaA1/EpsC-like NDP-sugar epimerase